MIVMGIEAALPETLWGWLAVLVAALTVVAMVGAVIMRTARAHINRRIDVTLEDKTKDTVEECLKPIEVKIDGLRINQTESTTAILKATKRVEVLEVTINNGLTHATEQTRQDVEELKAVIGSMQVQLAEMYVWMKATHTDPWDGTVERRT